MELYSEVRRQYEDFARYTDGESPCFEEWALSVAADEELVALIATLPAVKQQPNLIFAATRFAGVPAPAPFDVFRSGLLRHWKDIRDTVLSRATQTNEVGRLATLVPAFAEIERRDGRPLALLEVGASAGLCLYPDRYAYEWRSTIDGATATARAAAEPTITLTCSVSGAVPLPTRSPAVAWRGGLDLNPLDVQRSEDMAWLSMLVWPEQDDRRERLAQAIQIARAEPPHLVRGDLLTALPGLIKQVPTDTCLVVFHSAVVAYLDPDDRTRFQLLMSGLVQDGACHWVSNEARQVLPAVSATAPEAPASLPFVLAVDGQAVGLTHGHGASMTWFDSYSHRAGARWHKEGNHMSDEYDLSRFVTAQEAGGTYQQAVIELRQGRKVSHWMWFVFPQLAGLGRSATARQFAISSLDEARAYLGHEVLGPRLLECSQALAAVKERSAADVLGVVDAAKLRSSMTLFQQADPQQAVFGQVLSDYFGGQADPVTLELLRS